MSAIPAQPTDARARLLSHFSTAQGTTQHGQKWDDLYKEDFLPWDKGFPNPALVDLLTERHQDLSPDGSSGRKKALVPGCGKGYDVLLLAAFGYDAYGLEVSSTALEACRETEKECAGKGHYEEKIKGGGVTWLLGNFFGDDFLKDVKDGQEGFDLIYDYTFLSALPPTMRPAWSKRFQELLSPNGKIVCVEFPTYKPASSGGPPWALPPKIYLAHLSRPGVELSYAENGELEEQKLGEPSQDGLVRLEHFQPKRTHQIGYNSEGNITDWISIWAHPSK